MQICENILKMTKSWKLLKILCQSWKNNALKYIYSSRKTAVGRQIEVCDTLTCPRVWSRVKMRWHLLSDVEIMVYLGILVTRKYFVSQKILTEITAILSWISLWWYKYGSFVVKMPLQNNYFLSMKITIIIAANFLSLSKKGKPMLPLHLNFFCQNSNLLYSNSKFSVDPPDRILHFYIYFF